MEDDWDLQAVVRGFFNTNTTATTTTNNGSSSAKTRDDDNGTAAAIASTSTMEDLTFSFGAPLGLYGGFQQDDDNKLPCFLDLYHEPPSATTSCGLEELEQLYKPFVPNFQPISSANTLPISVTPPQRQQQHQQQKQQHQQQQKSAIVSTSGTAHSHGPRPKRRKNQQKRVVCEVPAEGLSSDMWAWRKYGQKPIKGSPYPRGYYRCSSSKGCLARKQVERSRTDPSMFIITYTAEHNHPVPTHRNSLAGSTRHKLSTNQKGGNAAINGEEVVVPTSSAGKPSCSSSSPTSTTDLSPSPTTPLMGSIIDEEIKEESRELDDEEMVLDEEDDQDDQILIPSDDFFMGLDELVGPTSVNSSSTDPVIDDCFSDHFPANFPSSWFVNNATTAAGGS